MSPRPKRGREAATGGGPGVRGGSSRATAEIDADVPQRLERRPRLIRWSEGDPERATEQTAALLREGRIVAHPTETVYGLAGTATDEQSYAGLVRIKGGTTPRAFLLLFAERARVGASLGELPPGGDELADAFWPGPLTLLFPPPPDLPPWWSGPDGDVAARVTPHPFCVGLIARVGAPLLSTSANRAGEAPLQSGQAIAAAFDFEEVRLVVEAGFLRGVPSTLLRWNGEAWTILRAGSVSGRAVREALRGRSFLYEK